MISFEYNASPLKKEKYIKNETNKLKTQIIHVPTGVYLDLLIHIGRWKFLDLPDLLELSNFDLKYDNLAHKIRALEANGFIKSLQKGYSRKQVYLTKKGLKLTPYNHLPEQENETLTHDMYVGRILRTLNKLPEFLNPQMEDFVENHFTLDNVEPDGSIEYENDDKSWSLALEVELFQKTKSRVKRKYSAYLRSSFDYVLYFSTKPNLIRNYLNMANDMITDVQKKLIFVSAPNLRIDSFNIEETHCFHPGTSSEFPTFRDLLNSNLFQNSSNPDRPYREKLPESTSLEFSEISHPPTTKGSTRVADL